MAAIYNNRYPTTAVLSRLYPLLFPLSLAYGAAAVMRRKLYTKHIVKPERLSCPVISIGNLTTGGTGKTPMTIYIASFLKAAGLSPLIISRGYKGSASKAGGLVSDGRNILMDADHSGDEPLLMAESLTDVPVAVGHNRYDVAKDMIERFSPDVILLDDGFQHFQLTRDIDIVLLDNARPLGNCRLLPAGPLREPPSSVKAADIIVFTRADTNGNPHPDRLTRYISGKPRFIARHVPFIAAWIPAGKATGPKDGQPDTDTLSHCRAFVFSALADNQAFLDAVRRLSVDIAGHRFFRDHHAFTPGDLAAISRAARQNNVDIIITSRKDYIKFRDQPAPDFCCDLVVLDVAISFETQTGPFEDLIRARLESIR